MAAPGGEHVYATLLLSDSYLPGALVLAHSLRDAGTTKKLAVLVTLDSVSADAVTQLKTLFDYVFPVPRIRNEYPSNLYLMNRADLHSAFTKINLWKHVQFSKIVFIDADVVAYRAPDELFALPHAFSAAPDIGWPDLFNTGVMVLTPNMGDFYAMLAMAERGISFDGADQGLLNMHFKNTYNRLSFTYNVTPSAHYQYLPAYRHFQSSINMVHFIGPSKPWFEGRTSSHGGSPYDEMIGRWWAVYDRHFREQGSPSQTNRSGTRLVQYFTKGEFQPSIQTAAQSTGEQHQQIGHEYNLSSEQHHSYQIHAPGHGQPEQGHDLALPVGDPAAHVPRDSSGGSFGRTAEAKAKSPAESQASTPSGQVQPPKEEKAAPRVFTPSWDAQRHPPPTDSKPEAMNFPMMHYEMSRDAAPFVPPARYPSPPKDMWYALPQEPPTPTAVRPNPIFPWEVHQPKPSRTFANELKSSEPPVTNKTESFPSDSKSEPSTPLTPSIKVTSSDPWTSFQRSNAWDDVPEIGRYVHGLEKHRRVKSQGSARRGAGEVTGPGPELREGKKTLGFKLTDFPSEVERPSLPVTPAPIHGRSFWGEGVDDLDRDEAGQPLPVAEGVPAQSDWDPVAQLQKLAKQQSDMLLRKFGGDEDESPISGRDIPHRSLPFGSEDVKSPTYVKPSPPKVVNAQPQKAEPTTSLARSVETQEGSIAAPSAESVTRSEGDISTLRESSNPRRGS